MSSSCRLATRTKLLLVVLLLVLNYKTKLLARAHRLSTSCRLAVLRLKHLTTCLLYSY
jgi:hypothetical protein